MPEIRQLLDRHPVELRLTGAAQVLARWAVEQPELAALRMEEEAVVISVRSPREILPRLQRAAAEGASPCGPSIPSTSTWTRSSST